MAKANYALAAKNLDKLSVNILPKTFKINGKVYAVVAINTTVD